MSLTQSKEVNSLSKRYSTHIDRRITRTVMVGDIAIGSDYPVRVQSMINEDTMDVENAYLAIKRLQEPLEPNYLIDKNSKKIKNYMGKFWKNAEITNGRLAMIGFLALIINYGFFGWIIPGFI